MDGAQALSDLTEISSQIQAAIVLDDDGATLATTLDEQRGPELAEAVQELLAAVKRASGDEGGELAQAEIATGDGSVFLVRDEQRTIAATTGPEPTVGLVFYDLKSCLRGFSEPRSRSRSRVPGSRRTGTRAMPRRKAVAGVALVAGSLAGVVALRRRSARRRDRVDVYFEDGSMVSLADGAPEASTVLPLARRILETTRAA